MKKIKILLKTLISLFALISLIMLFDLYELILFQPTKLDTHHAYQFATPYKEVNLKTQDGAILNALHFYNDKPKGVILYFHGNKGNLVRWGKIAENLATTYQYDVLVMDYRTYGKSTGKRSEAHFYADALVCYDYVASHYPDSNIVVFGRSLGSGIASWVATQKKVKSLILETPYYSLESLIQSFVPILPVRYFLDYHFDNHKNLQNVTCPVLLFHGTADKLIAYKWALQLYQSVEDKNVIFTTITNGTHHNLNTFPAYHKALSAFLNP